MRDAGHHARPLSPHTHRRRGADHASGASAFVATIRFACGQDTLGDAGMRRQQWGSIAVGLVLVACGDTRGGNDDLYGSAGLTAPTTSETGTGDDDDDEADDDDDAADDAANDPAKFDVQQGDDSDGDGDEGTNPAGCEKVDFLFLVDNSGSMEDEQDNLTQSFPGFISTIQKTLMAEDYHIMAIDTDASNAGGATIMCTPAPGCCTDLCMFNPGATCNGEPCMPADDRRAGAGRDDDLMGTDCALAGGKRYIVDAEPDLATAFDCVARPGTGGDGLERQMGAVTAAIGDLNGAGQCNEGFVRDDAVLVVTIVTDEEDDPNDGFDMDENSPGNPQAWYDAVVAAKNGDPTAVVILGLVGDTDVPGAICEPISDVFGAEPAPRLRQFVELFDDRGIWASMCSPDYTVLRAGGRSDRRCVRRVRATRLTCGRSATVGDCPRRSGSSASLARAITCARSGTDELTRVHVR